MTTYATSIHSVSIHANATQTTERVWEMKSLSAPPRTSSHPLSSSHNLFGRIMGTNTNVRIAFVLCRVYVSGIMDDTDGARGDIPMSPQRLITIIEWNKTLNAKSRIIAVLHEARRSLSDLFIYYLLVYTLQSTLYRSWSWRIRMRHAATMCASVLYKLNLVKLICRRHSSDVEWIIAYIQSSICVVVSTFYYLLSLWVSFFSSFSLSPSSSVSLLVQRQTQNNWRGYVEYTRRSLHMKNQIFQSICVIRQVAVVVSMSNVTCMSRTSASYAHNSSIDVSRKYWINNWASMTDKMSLISFEWMTNVYWEQLPSLACRTMLPLIYCTFVHMGA